MDPMAEYMSTKTKIPKIILQTSKNGVPPHAVNIILEQCPNWEYRHFTDAEILTYFDENPLEEFPLIKEQFNKIISGSHRSDLFRYYFLYINGGFYIDSDAKIQAPIETIVKDYHFVSVLSVISKTLFQGIIGAHPRNPIIYEALKHAYNVDTELLDKDYFLFCKEIYDIIFSRGYIHDNIKLYKEIRSDSEYFTNIYNVESNEKLFTHYFIIKEIPHPYVKPTCISDTKIGITFTVPKNPMDMFSNGIKQNAMFFYDLLNNIGYDVFLIVEDKDYETAITPNFWNIKDKYKYMTLTNLMKTPFHIIIQFGFQLLTSQLDFFKDSSVKTVFYVCGNSYLIQSETCLYKNEEEIVLQYNDLKYHKFSQLWLIPQMENTCKYYLSTLYRTEAKIVPFIWGPTFMETYEKELGRSIGYKNTGQNKSIAIFEPNLSLMKWAFPALLVCENTQRQLKNKDLIKHVSVTNIMSTSNGTFNIKLFNSLVKSLDLFFNKKIAIESRYNSLYFMSKYADIAVSHQMENNLNYLYLDLAWMGWPIVHNANLCKDVGYYYDGFNYEEGGSVLKNVILTHDENVDIYIKNNRATIDRYLPTNKTLQDNYKKLIDNLLEIEIKLENPKMNTFTSDIPKNIYICFKSLDKIKIYSNNWKKLNPDYEIKLYDDELCKEFLLKEYSQLHLDVFNFIPDGPIKADFWRVCIINKYGGLYVDADIEPLIPLNKYIDNDDDFATCISVNFKNGEKQWQLNPHFILSNKNNTVLQNCIDKYIEMYTNKMKYNYWEWSICSIMYIEGVTKKCSHTLQINSQKYKFLYEQNANECEYNGQIVLKNRYNDYKNHNFI
jgi:mannosyltransferase OCH1-like enzyme